MSKEEASAKTLQDCQKVIDRTAELVEDFIAGKMPEKYGSTIMAGDITAETGISISLTTPIVSMFIKNDSRVESKRGRHGGGLQVIGVDKK